MKTAVLFISLFYLVACSSNGSSGGSNNGEPKPAPVSATADLNSFDYRPINECTMQSMLKKVPMELAGQMNWYVYRVDPGWKVKNAIVRLTDSSLMGKNDLATAVRDNYPAKTESEPVQVDPNKPRQFFGLDAILETNKGDFKVVSWNLASDSPMPYLYMIDPAVYSMQKADGQPGEKAYTCLSTFLTNLPNSNWRPGQNQYLPVARLVLVDKATGQQNALSMEMNKYLTAESISQTALSISMARDFHPE
jgi:hypothetical protein